MIWFNGDCDCDSDCGCLPDDGVQTSLVFVHFSIHATPIVAPLALEEQTPPPLVHTHTHTCTFTLSSSSLRVLAYTVIGIVIVGIVAVVVVVDVDVIVGIIVGTMSVSVSVIESSQLSSEGFPHSITSVHALQQTRTHLLIGP